MICPDLCAKAADMLAKAPDNNLVKYNALRMHRQCAERDRERKFGGIDEDEIQLPSCTCQHNMNATRQESALAG